MTSQTLGRKAVPALIVAACALAALNLWLGAGIIQTHAGGDSPFLLQRVFELTANLRAGVFPARWMPDAAFGLGYPFFNFYAALPYYIAALLTLCGFDLLTAIKLTQTFGMFAAAATIWLYARAVLPRSGAVIASIAYTLAPYHLVNLYVRGDSLQEFYAFIWYPLILWAVDRVMGESAAAAQSQVQAARAQVIRNRLGATLALAFALAGLVLTHNVSALIFAPFIVLYAAARLAQRLRRHSLRQTVQAIPWLAGAAVLALLLSAWFWAPALGEAGLVQLNNQTTGYFDYNNHFRTLNLVQPSIAFNYQVDFQLSAFAMALPQAVLVLIGGAIWFVRGRRQSAFWLVVGLFVIATLMITPLSKPLWDAFPGLALTQFPWRFLSIQALFAALAIGGVSWLFHDVAHLAGRGTLCALRSPRLATLMVSVVTVLLLALALPGLPNERLDLRSEDVTVASLQQYEWLSGNIGTTIRAEYLPKTVQPRPQVGPDLLQQPRRALAVAGDIGASSLIQSSANRQVWHITVESDVATMTLPVLYWPGWQATARALTGAGALAPIRQVTLSPYVGSGWMQLSLPRGAYSVELSLAGTPLEQFAEKISLGSLVLLIFVSLVVMRLTAVPLIGLLRPVGVVFLCVAGIIMAGQAARAIYQPLAPPLQTVDYGDRQFAHRSPVTFRSASGDVLELVGATISPTQVQAGDVFTLSTTWRDGRAPAESGIEQELPSGGYFARLFYFGRSVSYGAPSLSQHTVISEALPGPLLLKLLARDGAGNVYTPTTQTGQALDHQLLTGLQVAAPADVQALSTPPIRIFPNGIRLRYTDWYQPTYNDVCFRATWDATRPTADALQVAFLLKGEDGRTVARADTQPQAGLAPTWSWPRGVPVSDGYCVPTTGRLGPGESYSLTMRWYRLLDQHSSGEVTLVGVREQATVWAPNRPHPVITDHLAVLPEVQASTQVTYAGAIRMMGYTVETTTQAIRLILFWSAVTTITQDYKMFIHLAPLTSAEPARQSDQLTRDGMYPTGMWVPGEIVSDTVTLDTAGVPAGKYQLAVGWYDPDTLERLPATSDTAPVRDGRYVLTEIQR